MANLGEIVGAVISQINRARCQADLVTVEIAQKYHEHPILSTFPVPRFSLGEVVIDLKVAIAGTGASGHRITPEAKSGLLANLEVYLSGLPRSEPAFANLVLRLPDLQKSWQAGLQAQIARIAPLIPVNVEVNTASLAASITETIHSQITVAAVASTVGIARAADRKALAELAGNLRIEIEPRVDDIVARAVVGPLATGDDLDVLVTAVELQSVAPERITTLRLSLRESDRSWTHVDSADGSGKDILTTY